MPSRLRRPPGHPVAAPHGEAAGPAPGYLPERATTWSGPLPFDYGVSLKLVGRPGNIVQGAITIGPEAAFVATGIGYGFEEDLYRAIEEEDFMLPGGAARPPAAGLTFTPRLITLAMLPPRALVEGFRIAPRALPLVFDVNPDERLDLDPEQLRFRTDPYQWSRVGELLQRRIRPVGHTFLLSLVDSASGRELQDEPVHNLAALGRGDGMRPFRPLARPMAFLPRSTIRVQVIERQTDRTGLLDVVLYGYKVPATSGIDEESMRRAVAEALSYRDQHLPGRVIPFDYVTQLRLTGQPRREVEVELPINVEGAFVATAVSYALDPPEEEVRLRLEPLTPPGAINPPPAALNEIRAPATNSFSLRDLVLQRFPPDALLDGIRLRPGYARFAFDGTGALSNAVRQEIADDLFERLNPPEEIRFRYRFSDGGAGRDLQNQPLFSLAGLGTADGRRPFRQLARPLYFEPRSTFRISVSERAGRGVLHLVLQGYKRLEGRTPP